MNSSKLQTAMGYDPFDPWPLDDHWVPTHRDWHRQRPLGEEGSPEWLAQILIRNPSRRALGVSFPED